MPRVKVVPRNDKWAVLEDGEQTGELYATQSRAETAGRARAKEIGAEFELHGKDGRIREKDSYGNDPRSSKG
jgi:hypothetical protein